MNVALALWAIGGCSGAPGGGTAVVDVAASELGIQPSIIDSDPSPPDGKVPVVVQFTRSTGFVQLAQDSTVTCNGVALTWNGLGYAERVPIVASGGSFAFVHVRAGVSTQVTVIAPARPVVSSPAGGARLSRTAPLVIGYPPGSGAGVRPGASDGTTGVSGAEQPDSGTAMLDVSKLQPGAGTIDLSRRVVSAPAGTGFGSVSATYSISSSDTHVTWQ